MTPEFYPFLYTIIGATVSLAGFTLGLFIFFHNMVSKRFDAQDARMDRMDDRFDRVDARFDRMDDRFDRQDDRFDRMEAKFDQLAEKFDRLSEKFDQLVERVHTLELRVAQLEWTLNAALYGRPVEFPGQAAAQALHTQPNPAPKRKAPARRRMRRSRRTGAPHQPETAS